MLRIYILGDIVRDFSFYRRTLETLVTSSVSIHFLPHNGIQLFPPRYKTALHYMQMRLLWAMKLDGENDEVAKKDARRG